MFKKQALKLFCILFAISELIVLSLFELSGDTLFFLSDFKSIIIIIQILSILVLVPFSLFLYVCYRLFSKQHRSFINFTSNIISSLLLVNLIYFILNFVDVKFLLTVKIKNFVSHYISYFYPEFIWIIIFFLLYIFSWRLINKLPYKNEVYNRSSKSYLIIVPILMILSLIFIAQNCNIIFDSKNDIKEPKHLVLIVLDARPVKYSGFLSENNKKNELRTNRLIFPNTHTNAVWTLGFFSALYHGKQNYAFSFKRKFKNMWNEAYDKEINLLKILQEHGVKIRIFNYHKNGLPDVSSGRITTYSGIRSKYLNINHSSFLASLNFDWSMPFNGTGKKSDDDLRSYFIDKAIRFFYGSNEYINIFIEMLTPEIINIKKINKQSFIIFHNIWAGNDMVFPQAWSDDDKSIFSLIRKNDYQYTQDQESVARTLEHMNQNSSKQLDADITEFISNLVENNILKDTMIIITSDHGMIAERGKLWYGFHPDEEVTRTPLFVYGSDRQGTDNRLVETIDLTQTILDYFNCQASIDPRAKSIFNPMEKQFTVSFTQASEIRKEWFLIIYKNYFKYIFNIHPEGNGKSIEQKVELFKTTTVNEGDDVIKKLRPEIKQAFNEYSIYDYKFHPKYR